MGYLKISFCLLFNFLTFFLYGQKDLSQILFQEHTYENIVQECNSYFKTKHPVTTPNDLVTGIHRDGDYVRFKRWEYFWKHHQMPNGQLGDPTQYFRYPKAALRNRSPFSEVQWKNIGLHKNLGAQVGIGRTTAIDFHPTDPNTFYVSSAYGGIWKTEDKGKNYRPISDNLPTLAVAAVIVDNEAPNTIYAATGDRTWFGYPSIGVYKSTNGGESWKPTALEWQFGNQIKVYALVANPNDAKEMFLASNVGLFRTKDGFETVSKLFGFGSTDVKFKPGDPTTVYAITDGRFWRSTDGGENFMATQAITEPNITRISVSPADPNLVYFSNLDRLYQSRNSGLSFPVKRHIGILGNGSLGYVQISPTNPNVLYGGFVNSWKSIDNGKNWEQITCTSSGEEIHVDNHFASYNPNDPGYIYICNDGGLYRFRENECLDCRACFPFYEDLSSGLYISQYYDISVSQQSNSLISGGTQDNGSFFRSKNNRWQFYAGTGDGMMGAIDPTNDKYQYWSFQLGSINRSQQNQNTCISCNLPNDESGNGEWVTPFVLDPQNPSIIFAGFSRIYRSYDRGDIWQEASPPLPSDGLFDKIAIAPSDDRYVYALGDESWYRTQNAHNTFMPTWTKHRLPTGTVSSIAVHPTERETVYITLSGYKNGQKVYKSMDGGENWSNITGSLPNTPAMVVKVLSDPNYDEALFVGTGAGVYYRDKGMQDWVEYGQLPHTLVTDIEFQYLNQIIRIGTYGRSIFEAALPLSPCLYDNGADSDQDGVCDAFDICPGGDDLADLDNDLAPDACETYCLAFGTVGTGNNFITEVQIDDFSNSSRKSSYSDFRSMEQNVLIGNTYQLGIRLAEVTSRDSAYAWVDYNHNKEFEAWEAIELSSYNAQNLSVGQIQIPEDALTGKATLRIRNISTLSHLADPCNSYFGEVEDYTLNINSLLTSTSNKLEEKASFKVFPNPGQDVLHIQFEKSSMQGAIYVNIVDFSGRTLVGKRLTPGQLKSSLSLPTATLSKGIYFIKIQNNQQQLVQKWVKQ